MHDEDHHVGSTGPLSGVRVLELGSFIAGPFAGQIFGDYGADVIKVESPEDGDPMRQWGIRLDGDSLWWPTIARNKRSVCIDLRNERGRQVVRRLARQCDIVVENFRPGRLADWGLDYDTLAAEHPQLIMVHVSGYGQTGPKSEAAGFGSIGEAVGGIRYTTGDPRGPSSRVGISLGDALSGLFAVIGALAALHEMQKSNLGQEVDVAIYEAVAALMESSMADFELGGVRRERTGSVLPGVAPSNAYPTADGSEVLIAANADSVFSRLATAMEMPELAVDEKYHSHLRRGENMAELDEIISRWTQTRDAATLLDLLERHGVPADRLFTAQDMLTDPHYAARDMVLRRRSLQGWQVPMTGIVPKFSRTPGSVRSTGPGLGAQTRQVLRDLARIDDAEYLDLEAQGTVSGRSDNGS